MAKTIIAGNWKMNLLRNSAAELARQIVDGMAESGDAGPEVVLCPPALYLEAVVDQTLGSQVGVGAQNCYFEEKGAFTGEISPDMLAEIGCSHVILGHSERRALLGETDEMVNRKLIAALRAGLCPIVCLGETLEQREAGKTADVIHTQFLGSLGALDENQFQGLVIAYEPVWAIGTGKTASPEQAQEVHADLRKMIENSYNSRIAGDTSILYGGSVKPQNASELLAQPDINGALVGGASLKASDFLAIVDAAFSRIR